ncbi:MAG TPA: hypothetical protein PKX07_00660 [Aggregatilineales bacterium]|jgi:hypothetical protein|nr:hypothetical protein [Aggregatilineales bacterium]
MSTPLYDKIMSQKGMFERIVAKIPGFKGYHEKQARRTADRLLREYISEQLQERIRKYGRIEKKLLDETGLKYMSRSRDIKSVMQTFQDRVETAAPKYDGMFAQIKVSTADLEKIYAFDEALMRYVDTFDELLLDFEKAVTEGPEAIDGALDAIYDEAVEANEAFKLRDDVILQLGNELNS